MVSVFILLIIGIGILFIGAFFTLFFIRKVEPGYVGVRVGFAGYVISDTWVLGIPFLTTYNKMDITVQKLEIARKGGNGLICQDNIRADIVVAFYVKVNYPKVDYGGIDPSSPEGQAMMEAAMRDKNRFDDVRKVAQTVGCDRVAEADKLHELFEAKFSEALKTAGKMMDFQTLDTEQMLFRDEIKAVIGQDLEGYVLTDVAIDYLEQTPLEYMDQDNILDAKGIKKITEITSHDREIANLRAQERDVEIKNQNVRAQMDIRELEREYEEFLANQQSRLADELAKAFPDMETVEEIRAHIWKDHPVWGRLTTVWDNIKKLEEEVDLLKSKNPPNS